MASLERGRVLVFLPAFVEPCRPLNHCRRGARDVICQWYDTVLRDESKRLINFISVYLCDVGAAFSIM